MLSIIHSSLLLSPIPLYFFYQSSDLVSLTSWHPPCHCHAAILYTIFLQSTMPLYPATLTLCHLPCHLPMQPVPLCQSRGHSATLDSPILSPSLALFHPHCYSGCHLSCHSATRPLSPSLLPCFSATFDATLPPFLPLSDPASATVPATLPACFSQSTSLPQLVCHPTSAIVLGVIAWPEPQIATGQSQVVFGSEQPISLQH